MKPLRLVLVSFLLALCVKAQGQQQQEEEDPNWPMTNPRCAKKCMLPAIKNSECDATDELCICLNKELNAEIETCVAATCSVKEALTTKRLSSAKCGYPVRNRKNVVIITGTTGGALALLAFILRVIARLPRVGAGQFFADDWIIAVVQCFSIPMSALSVVIANYGLGKDIWEIPFDNISRVLKMYYFEEIVYLLAITLTKLSLHCFYLRIFPLRRFRISIYVLMGFTSLYGILFIFLAIFQCWPIHASWEHWDGEPHGHCLNLNAVIWTSSAYNIVLDFVTLIIPLHELSKLELWRKKKFQLLSMFGVGSFVTVVSILRLYTLVRFGKSTNITWDYVELGYWSTIEIHVGIICTCMPAIRNVFRRAFPSLSTPTENPASGNTDSRYAHGSNGASKFSGAWAGSNSVRSDSRQSTRQPSRLSLRMNHGSLKATPEADEGASSDAMPLFEMDEPSTRSNSRREMGSVNETYHQFQFH